MSGGGRKQYENNHIKRVLYYSSTKRINSFLIFDMTLTQGTYIIKGGQYVMSPGVVQTTLGQANENVITGAIQFRVLSSVSRSTYG